METIGSRIAAFREARHLKQVDVFRATGIKQQTLSSVESGAEPKSGIVAALLAAYPDLNPDWLLTGAGPMLRGSRAGAPPAPPTDPPPASPQMRVVQESAEVHYLKEKVKDQAFYIDLLREQLERVSSYLPDQVGKLALDSYAAAPTAAARIGFAQQAVTMVTAGRVYTEWRRAGSGRAIGQLKVA